MEQRALREGHRSKKNPCSAWDPLAKPEPTFPVVPPSANEGYKLPVGWKERRMNMSSPANGVHLLLCRQVALLILSWVGNWEEGELASMQYVFIQVRWLRVDDPSNEAPDYWRWYYAMTTDGSLESDKASGLWRSICWIIQQQDWMFNCTGKIGCP